MVKIFVGNKKDTFKDGLYLIWGIIVLVGVALLLYRIRFGVDLTDESWYVAEPYVVARGWAIPFVNNWTQAPGFTIPLASLFKIFIGFNGSTEGIFLFSRLLYCLWILIVMSLSIFILGRNTDRHIPIIAICPLLFVNINLLYSINYNTIGLVYLLLVLVLVLFVSEHENKRNQWPSFVAGIIIARAIIGTPFIIVAWLAIIFLYIRHKRWKSLFSYIIGNVLMAVLVIGICCIAGGITNFITGMKALINDSAYFKIERVASYESDLNHLWNFLVPAVIFLIITILFRFLNNRYGKRILYLLTISSIVHGLYRLFVFGVEIDSIKWIWFASIIISLYERQDENKKKMLTKFSNITVIYFLVYLLSSFGNIYGFHHREYWLLVPCVISMLSLLYAIDNKPTAYSIMSIVIAFFAIGLIKVNFINTYRDREISFLDTKVENGIWKGCYTTKERAYEIVELEKYIRSVTGDEDDVLFLDHVPFAYLMTDARSCSPTTLDGMQYTYQVDNVEIMYSYFAVSERIPNKIIYIDYGRDDKLSIEDEWKFNAFVENNYILQDAFNENIEMEDAYKSSYEEKRGFRVKCYTIKDAETANHFINNWEEKD